MCTRNSSPGRYRTTCKFSMFRGGNPLSAEARVANVRNGSAHRSSRSHAVLDVRWDDASWSFPVVERFSRCFADASPSESDDDGPRVAATIASQ